MASTAQEDVEVRREDQMLINEFGKLNNILMENRAEQAQVKDDLTKLDDAGTDIMMAVEGKLMLLIGEAFVEADEDGATRYVEKKTGELQARLASLQEEDARITARQAELKAFLYGRFGDSINLEN